MTFSHLVGAGIRKHRNTLCILEALDNSGHRVVEQGERIGRAELTGLNLDYKWRSFLSFANTSKKMKTIENHAFLLLHPRP